METVPTRLTAHFFTLRDHRVRARCQHRLLDVVIIALCAVIANCNDWQQIALFARERLDWFRRFLRLPNGAPSHDTFERIFARIDPVAFQRCFASWTRAATSALGIPHIAIDGKTLRGSGGGASGLGQLHLVSAWATDAGLSLGQVAVEGMSNEITAIPKLLELLDLKGAFVTIDAMGCQKEIARQVVEGGGEYLLAVKGNQERLFDDVRDGIGTAMDEGADGPEYEVHVSEEVTHGRKQTRTCVVVHDVEEIRDRSLWPKLATVGMCICEREIDGKRGGERRYFISSSGTLGAKEFGEMVRNHWRIENHLHWQLDVTFREDENRVGERNAAENLSLLRKWALGLLKQEPTKLSMACKRLRAALSTSYLENVLHSADNLGQV